MTSPHTPRRHTAKRKPPPVLPTYLTPDPHLGRFLVAALTWLYGTEQPEDSHIFHLGETLRHPQANRTYSFGPSSAQSRPVIVINVANPHWNWDTHSDTFTLEPDELDRAAHLVTALGHTVAATWNGHPAGTGSLSLRDPAHPTLLASYQRYSAGCPDHPKESVFCNCDTWTAAYARRVRPTHPLDDDGNPR